MFIPDLPSDATNEDLMAKIDSLCRVVSLLSHENSQLKRRINELIDMNNMIHNTNIQKNTRNMQIISDAVEIPNWKLETPMHVRWIEDLK